MSKSMKTVCKSTIDELLRVVRKYARTGDVDILGKQIAIASNQVVYDVLKVIGIEVVEQ